MNNCFRSRLIPTELVQPVTQCPSKETGPIFFLRVPRPLVLVQVLAMKLRHVRKTPVCNYRIKPGRSPQFVHNT